MHGRCLFDTFSNVGERAVFERERPVMLVSSVFENELHLLQTDGIFGVFIGEAVMRVTFRLRHPIVVIRQQLPSR